MSRRTGAAVTLTVAFLSFLLDQSLKRIVETSMTPGESIPLIRGVLHLTYIQNAGGAFGILASRPQILLIGSVIALVAVLWMLLASPPSLLMSLGTGLILGGASGNLLDRLSTGAVTDFLDLRVWPIFNAADMAIVAGVVMLALTALSSPGSKR